MLFGDPRRRSHSSLHSWHLLLVPPGEGDLAREIGHDIDPDAIFQARSKLRADIGERLDAPLEAIYQHMTEPTSLSHAKSAGRRALRNVALDLLAANAFRWSSIRARHSNLMPPITRPPSHGGTRDTVVALYAPPQASHCGLLHTRPRPSDALVVDKWFALQATIPEEKYVLLCP